MKPRITVITLGVDDLPKAVRFYRDGLGLPTDGIIGTDEQGTAGVYVQDFVPGRDTTATRRKLAGFDPGTPAESFAVSPDGAFVTVAARESLGNVVLAEPVAGVVRPRRP